MKKTKTLKKIHLIAIVVLGLVSLQSIFIREAVYADHGITFGLEPDITAVDIPDLHERHFPTETN